MFKRLQLVALGVVVLQAGSMSAMENKAPNSPRKVTNSPRKLKQPLSCSQEARRSDSGDFAVVKGLKRSLEARKDESSSAVGVYYPWPGGNPEVSVRLENTTDQMKPWYPYSW